MLTAQDTLVCGTVRARFEQSQPDLKMDDKEWGRLTTAFSLATGSSVLDVGTGHGIFVHMCADSERFHKVSALDIQTHSKAIIRLDVSYIEGSISDPELPLMRHDTVVCMEVLEHVESIYNDVMLSNLRNAAEQRLIVTVPFHEPEPLWWHDRPGGHRQRFTLDKIGELFPEAVGTIQPRYGVEWVFIVEDKQKRFDGFRLLPRKQFEEVFFGNQYRNSFSKIKNIFHKIR